MAHSDEELVRTRTTLIHRLKDWQDQASWQEFFDTYWKLIYGLALKSGLTETEAQEVVQETMISVAKHIPTFKYDRKIGSFKAWLFNMTRWRITDQFRKRRPHVRMSKEAGANGCEALLNVDSTTHELDEMWDAEWEKNLLDAAISKLKRRLNPQKYQIFDFYVNKGWPPGKVAGTFGISVSQVYLAKHRVTELIKTEVERLRVEMV